MVPKGSLPRLQEPATCPYSEPDQSSPYPHIPFPEDPFEYYLLIYACVFQVVSFPQVSPPVYASPLPIRATYAAHLILLDFINRAILGEEYRSLSSSLCSFLHSPVISSLLGPNILLNTLFSNTLSLRSSLNVGDQVTHPYKQRQNYSSVYLNLCVAGQQTGRQNILHRLKDNIP